MMETTDTRGFACTCRGCGMVLYAVGARLTDAALATLRGHVRVAHPDVPMPADAGAGAVLAHYNVTPTPATSS